MLFSNRDLKRIIVPLIFSQFFTIFVGMVDTIMVAGSGQAAVSAVSLVNTVNLMLSYLYGSLCSGGSIVIAQLLGKKDKPLAQEAGKQLVYVALFISTFISLIMVFFRKQILGLVFGQVEKDVMENALNYSLYTSLSMPFSALYSACSSFLTAQGKTKITMSTSILVNVLNVGGNATLIMGFGMGATGAALATLFARVVGTLVILVKAHNKNNEIYLSKLYKYKPNGILIKNICGVGIPSGLENAMFQFGKVVTLSLIAGFGTAQIAANATANSLANLQYASGNAIGAAMSSVIGRCVGAGEKDQAKYYAKKLLGIAYVCIISISIVICLLSSPLIGLYGLDKEATALATKILLTQSIFVCSLWPIAFPLSSSFKAASDVRFIMIIAIVSMWTLRVGLSFVFAGYLGMGAMGVWYAMFCDWLFRAIVFGTRFISGKWLTKYKEININKPAV